MFFLSSSMRQASSSSNNSYVNLVLPCTSMAQPFRMALYTFLSMLIQLFLCIRYVSSLIMTGKWSTKNDSVMMPEIVSKIVAGSGCGQISLILTTFLRGVPSHKAVSSTKVSPSLFKCIRVTVSESRLTPLRKPVTAKKLGIDQSRMRHQERF